MKKTAFPKGSAVFCFAYYERFQRNRYTRRRPRLSVAPPHAAVCHLILDKEKPRLKAWLNFEF
jgi:hypothetical protein